MDGWMDVWYQPGQSLVLFLIFRGAQNPGKLVLVQSFLLHNHLATNKMQGLFLKTCSILCDFSLHAHSFSRLNA